MYLHLDTNTVIRTREIVAILDIEMPGINGIEAAQQIRQADKDCWTSRTARFPKSPGNSLPRPRAGARSSI